MTRYLLSVHAGNGGPREPMTAEEMQQGYEKIQRLEAEMKASDTLRFSGRLGEPGTARVVRPSKGRVRTTDGPYAETKEQMGGFWLIRADDLDAALEWAAKATAACELPIEVRVALLDRF